MMAAPDRFWHAVTVARNITQAAEELRFRRGHHIDGSTFERAGLDFERGHDGATEPDPTQRRQRHDRSQKRIVSMHLDATEAGGNIRWTLEAPKQQMRGLHVIGRQARFDERGPEES